MKGCEWRSNFFSKGIARVQTLHETNFLRNLLSRSASSFEFARKSSLPLCMGRRNFGVFLSYSMYQSGFSGRCWYWKAILMD